MGTAGWGNPRSQRGARPPDHSALQHYAAFFNCLEINSSFYRSHQRSTYERWAASTGRTFRFSVKIPRAVSHDSALRDCEAELDLFLTGVRGLGSKLAVLLLQLPPQAEWQARVARRFFDLVRTRTKVPIVCEPRHASWSTQGAERVLTELGISLVCAHPLRLPRNWMQPGGIRYYRLHGSPRVYWSSYPREQLEALADRIREERARFSQVWCIFDNTAAGAAWDNASALSTRLRRGMV